MANRGRPRKNTIESNVDDTNLDNEQIDIIEPNQISNEKQDIFDVIGDGTNSEYNPFAESVIERDYSTPKTASGVVDEIEEPTFIPPSYEDIVQERENEKQDEFEKDNVFDNINPAMNDLSEADKRIACESLVDTCLDAYEQLHTYAQMFVKVSEETMLEKQAENKIDISEQIPISENGDTMSIGEFVSQFNDQSSQALKYDKEFGYKVRPAMVRVFIKRGWGMTDEQFLLYMFGKDIAVKVSLVYQLNKTIKNTLTIFEKSHKQNNNFSAKKTNNKIVEQDEQDYYFEDDTEENSMFDDINTYTTIVDNDNDNQTIANNFDEIYTETLNINMPQNPKDSLSQHPIEVQNIIKKSKKNE